MGSFLRSFRRDVVSPSICWLGRASFALKYALAFNVLGAYKLARICRQSLRETSKDMRHALNIAREPTCRVFITICHNYHNADCILFRDLPLLRSGRLPRRKNPWRFRLPRWRRCCRKWVRIRFDKTVVTSFSAWRT